MDGLVAVCLLIGAFYAMHRQQIAEARAERERAYEQQKQMYLFVEYLAEKRREAVEARAAAVMEAEQRAREAAEKEARKKRTIVTEDGEIVELDKLELMI